MNGFNVTTGTLLGGYDHLLQSVKDILTTPVGSRVMLREYGSDIPKLLDSPMNNETFAKIYAAIVDALNKWEPRLTVDRMQVVSVSANGVLSLSIEGRYLGEYQKLSLDMSK